MFPKECSDSIWDLDERSYPDAQKPHKRSRRNQLTCKPSRTCCRLRASFPDQNVELINYRRLVNSNLVHILGGETFSFEILPKLLPHVSQTIISCTQQTRKIISCAPFAIRNNADMFCSCFGRDLRLYAQFTWKIQ